MYNVYKVTFEDGTEEDVLAATEEEAVGEACRIYSKATGSTNIKVKSIRLTDSWLEEGEVYYDVY